MVFLKVSLCGIIRLLTSSPSLYREIRYLRQAGPHPNIIQLYGAMTVRAAGGG
jgi:hypothetical protein